MFILYIVPDMSGTITLRELVRADIAKELAMTGRIITAEEGAKIGLVTRTCDDPMQEAIKVSEEICTRSPDAVACTKQLLQRTRVCSEEMALKEETKIQWQLIASYNQMVTASRNFISSVKVPFMNRKSDYVMTQDPRSS